MTKFYNVSTDEQETIINIDYKAKKLKCYTSRQSVYDRLFKKLGTPTKTFYTNKKISGASWSIPFKDKKKANIIFSKTIVVGNL